MLQNKFEASERRACELVGQSRSSQRRQLQEPTENERVVCSQKTTPARMLVLAPLIASPELVQLMTENLTLIACKSV